MNKTGGISFHADFQDLRSCHCLVENLLVGEPGELAPGAAWRTGPWEQHVPDATHSVHVRCVAYLEQIVNFTHSQRA